MRYQEYAPHPALARFVKTYWILHDSAPGTTPAAERIVPDGRVELIFHFGERFVREDPKGNWIEQPRSFLAGQITRRLIIKPSGRVGILGVRFHPGGAYPFLATPLSELTDATIDVASLWGAEAAELEERLCLVRNDEQRIGFVDAFLCAQMRPTDMTDRSTEEAVRRIVHNNGSVAIESLTGDLGIGSRQLERKFRAQVGLTPKLLARIVRLQRVFQLLETRPAFNLTAIAQECDYFDQSHCIRDFKSFTGLTPRAYFAERHQMNDFFVADD